MFSSSFTTFFCVLVAAILVRSAPTPPLDAPTLLKNGQEAQRLNTLFQTIKETDPCTSGDKACMSGGVAMCIQGKWNASNGKCATSQQCFALPSVREAGTLVTCTSEKSALSAINGSGATGGIFGTAGGNSTSTDDDSAAESNGGDDDGDDDEYEAECDDGDDGEDEDTTATSIPLTSTFSSSAEKSTQSTFASSSASDRSPQPTLASPSDAAPDRVTVTVTLTAQPTTFAPQTRTLSPEDASSVLSSLMANGATIIVSPSAINSVDTKEPVITTAPAAQPSGATLNQATPTTVSLTTVPSASASAVPAGGYDYDY